MKNHDDIDHARIDHTNENDRELQARLARADSPENVALEEAVNEINRRRDRIEAA